MERRMEGWEGEGKDGKENERMERRMEGWEGEGMNGKIVRNKEEWEDWQGGEEEEEWVWGGD